MINDQFPLKGSSREMGRDGHAPPEEVDAPGSRLTFGFGSSDCGSFAARLQETRAPENCRQVASEEAARPPSEAAERREPRDGVSPPETLPGRAARERRHASAA